MITKNSHQCFIPYLFDDGLMIKNPFEYPQIYQIMLLANYQGSYFMKSNRKATIQFTLQHIFVLSIILPGIRENDKSQPCFLKNNGINYVESKLEYPAFNIDRNEFDRKMTSTPLEISDINDSNIDIVNISKIKKGKNYLNIKQIIIKLCLFYTYCEVPKKAKKIMKAKKKGSACKLLMKKKTIDDYIMFMKWAIKLNFPFLEKFHESFGFLRSCVKKLKGPKKGLSGVKEDDFIQSLEQLKIDLE